MKRAVSVSLGASSRDYRCETELLGRPVTLERIGTDGDVDRAERLLGELDGQVDALGLGGADLGLSIGDRWHPIHSVDRLRRAVRHTPLVDGSGLKRTLEKRVVASFLDDFSTAISPRRALLVFAADRWGMTEAFEAAGFELVLGDLMFSLGLPLPIHKTATAKRLAAVCAPIVGRLPFHWVYPTGPRQSVNRPRHERYFAWASVIAGDCHYIRSSAPADLGGKIILTNTTTARDRAFFRDRGAAALVTTTPRIGDRSFGTNLIEAGLVAVAAKGRTLCIGEYDELVRAGGFAPTVERFGG